MTLGLAKEEWDSHLLLLYQDDADREDSVASWIQRGLELGEKVIYTLWPGDMALLLGLSERGVAVPTAARRGQFAVLPLEEFYPPDGQAALVQRALDEGYPGVRLAAHANAALIHLAVDGYQATDHLLDELCAHLPVSALCQCDTGRIAALSLDVVIDSHTRSLVDPQLRLRRRGDAVVVDGELDIRSAHAVKRWLAHFARAQGDGNITIDLSGLAFIDVAGCRALVEGTVVFRGHGGTVLLEGAQTHVARVIRLCEVHRIPGVELR